MYLQIIEDVMTLLDLLTVWESESAMIEMEQFGIFILLAYAGQEDIEVRKGYFQQNNSL